VAGSVSTTGVAIGVRHHVPVQPHSRLLERRIDESITWGSELVTVSRNLNDIITSLITLPPLGMALASAGRYREAIATFAQARTLGQRAHASSFVARAVSMSRASTSISVTTIPTASSATSPTRSSAPPIVVASTRSLRSARAPLHARLAVTATALSWFSIARWPFRAPSPTPRCASAL
jgi:hypothetical protein